MLGLIKKACLLVLALAGLLILFILYRALKLQYRLVSSTKTLSKLAPDDPIFRSASYIEKFGGREWAKIESFGTFIVIDRKKLRQDLRQRDDVHERKLLAEIWARTWGCRVLMQHEGRVEPQFPVVGSHSQSPSIRADIVEITPPDMYITITTRANGFMGGFEAVVMGFPSNDDTIVFGFKYAWHNDVLLPRKWKQALGIWMQLNTRRMWLCGIAEALTDESTPPMFPEI
ncbi:hypothetical protein BX600DRAFT_443220 [Xylariales sp. PMI_506]|nr:hypothetical protein BX600DRAFT_443220 [Xylariales sp. PMI_506]